MAQLDIQFAGAMRAACMVALALAMMMRLLV
jgi:hypothetical protein